jgi:cobalt-zinc-cadmium efflux system outer membrane protein
MTYFRSWRETVINRLAFFAVVFICGLFAVTTAWCQGPTKITLDQALQMALEHNHALKGARTTILQNEAQEITANLRPNPVLSGDALYFPFTHPGQYGADDYLNQTAQFDLGVSYTWERGGKRHRRLQAAKDATSVTKSTVSDNERALKFNTASQFINVLLAQANLDLALEDLKSFQKTVETSETRFKAGDISKDDYLKIRIQMLPFQNDVNAARLAKAQALVALRELLGYESVPPDYDVEGALDYKPLKASKEGLLALALKERPDLLAAQLGITAAESLHDLAKANSQQDLTTTLNFTHVAGNTTAGVLFSFPLGIFNRNQGEIARTKQAVYQSQELFSSAKETVIGDVSSAFDGVRSNDEAVSLYRSGYLDNAKESRDIEEFAYKQGSASLLDFLDAERSYRATQIAYRQALASYMLALEQLREAVGVRRLAMGVQAELALE